MNDVALNFTAPANTRIHLGVCGSVAAYRSLDLLRILQRMNVAVSVTLTPAAQRFITPLNFTALGASPVYTSMFDDAGAPSPFAHLEPGQIAHALLIAPASAAMLSRLAYGQADHLLACQALAHSGPLIIAPAMNPAMWQHAATQTCVRILQERGAIFVMPACGGTACGDTGQGRLADIRSIALASLRAVMPQDMQGKRVMVTLGPTREPWDALRFWSNPSTGTMGAALAMAAWLRGATVDAICGPGAPLLVEDAPLLAKTPSVKKDAPLVGKDTPSMSKDTPSMSKDTPLVIGAAPLFAKAALSVSGDAPLVIGDAPLFVKNAASVSGDAPLLIKAAPLVIGDAPLFAKDAPLPNEDTPLFGKDTRLLLKDAPLLLKDEPLLGEDAPLFIEGACLHRHDVGCASEMHAVAEKLWPQADLGIFTAAVADFAPETCLDPGKFKKSLSPYGFSLYFSPTVDILQTLAAHKRSDQYVIGFAAESANIESAVRTKLQTKNADMVVGNLLQDGFGTMTNTVYVEDRHARCASFKAETKASIAMKVLSWFLSP